jgi:hypothetical protein
MFYGDQEDEGMRGSWRTQHCEPMMCSRTPRAASCPISPRSAGTRDGCASAEPSRCTCAACIRRRQSGPIQYTVTATRHSQRDER